jgi:polyhydroxyalkanoate synthesis repressor PhaR
MGTAVMGHAASRHGPSLRSFWGPGDQSRAIVVSQPRIIKKYPNRRLYDTTLSRYITLEDVRRLVLDHSDFKVIDSKTDEDITRTILLQIIIEQEEDGQPMFTTEVLEQFIRFYGDTLQGMITSYLEKSLKLFVEQQHRLRDRMQNVMVNDPFTLMRDITERNLALWKEMQDNFFRAGSGRRERAEDAEGEARATPKTKDERSSGDS